ncbi:peptide methionine sulfoxide reductase MsrA [Pelagophyceae sp. CCMP2097]|nr:peptide methionine sulfoxide reductase MsrA [Pelagophyceae sp. CCMP2097]
MGNASSIEHQQGGDTSAFLSALGGGPLAEGASFEILKGPPDAAFLDGLGLCFKPEPSILQSPPASFSPPARRGPDAELPRPEDCLAHEPSSPGAAAPESKHLVTGKAIVPTPTPPNCDVITLGMGCFWCAEDLFAHEKGLYSSAVGYAQGYTEHPTYEMVSSGRTNHNEVVRLVYDKRVLPLATILRLFWQAHDPTTPFKQGGDVGTQYRSGIYYHSTLQRAAAERSKRVYAVALAASGHVGSIVTEILPASHLYLAEAHHQQRDSRPDIDAYCGLSPTGVSCPPLTAKQQDAESDDSD